MIENYTRFLEFLNEKLNTFFEEQKPYIFCKKGCSLCCQNAEFPYSKLEASYLKLGYVRLDKNIRDIVTNNIIQIKKEKADCKEEKFLYTCPFLINDVCSVYEYRGIICRTFGLITDNDKDNVNVPFCHKFGLNYSNVTDLETKKITEKKWKESGISVEPHEFNNVSYKHLTGEKIEEIFEIKFEEKRPLIDWF